MHGLTNFRRDCWLMFDSNLVDFNRLPQNADAYNFGSRPCRRVLVWRRTVYDIKFHMGFHPLLVHALYRCWAW